ncbi:MAG: PAS domain-containing sensor histidine kinase [Hyphomonas sp.]
MTSDTPTPPELRDMLLGQEEASLKTLLQSILASVPDAMIVINERGNIVAFSAAAERLFGYTAEQMQGQNIKVLMSGDDHSYHDNYINNYLRTGKRQIIGIGRVVEARLADGTTIPVELKIGDANYGEHHLFTGYIRDLSEQQASEHRMNELQIELTNFSRLSAVGTMASAMAHELNQPLTAVANYLEAARDLLDSPDPETIAMVQEALTAASTQSIRAGQIIRRLRDYVSRGEIDARPVDLRPVVTEAIALSKVGIEGQQLAPVIDKIDDDLPLVLADRLQIRQVIVNLVKNAVEALANTPDPLVTVTVASVDDGHVEIAVKDNGPGFDLPKGHEPFDAFYSSKPNGMGLGLSICQTIIDAHNGEIIAESAPGEGATFRFRLKRDID